MLRDSSSRDDKEPPMVFKFRFPRCIISIGWFRNGGAAPITEALQHACLLRHKVSTTIGLTFNVAMKVWATEWNSARGTLAERLASQENAGGSGNDSWKLIAEDNSERTHRAAQSRGHPKKQGS